MWVDGIHLRSPRGQQGVPAGDDRRACRRHQRTDRPRRRVPGEFGVVGRSAAVLPSGRDGAPVLAVGDGASGFWKSLCEVLPIPPSSGAGFTSPPSLPACRSRRIQVPKPRWPRSTTHRPLRILKRDEGSVEPLEVIESSPISLASDGYRADSAAQQYRIWALPPRSGHGICGYAACGSVAGVRVLS